MINYCPRRLYIMPSVNKVVAFVFGLSLLIFLNVSQLEAQELCSVSGIITAADTERAVEMATISIKETNQWATTNKQGEFSIENIEAGSYTVCVSCIGFKAFERQVELDQGKLSLKIQLQVLSFALEEVLVTATEREELASTSSIGRTAMKHLQPASVAELLELMPGGEPTHLNFSEMPQMSMRQVGSDVNSTLGLLVVMDGVPLSNDQNRQLPAGGSADLKMTDRYSQGRGVDLRELSTDEIEKIEIVRGVPSAEYGDMTSGLIKITRKSGQTPITARLKSNANQKLFYLGKGWQLPNGDKLNLAADYLTNKADPRNSLNQYQRVTLSSRYNKGFSFLHGKLALNSFVDYIGTLDKEKNDKEQLDYPDDKYSSSYQKLSGNIGLVWTPQRKTGWTFSSDLSIFYSHDELIRSRAVSLKGPTPSFNSLTEGRHRATYLPMGYKAEHRVDGKPLRLNSSLKIGKSYNWLGTVHKLKVGANYSYSKNLGDGQVFDINAPLFFKSAAAPMLIIKYLPHRNFRFL